MLTLPRLIAVGVLAGLITITLVPALKFEVDWEDAHAYLLREGKWEAAETMEFAKFFDAQNERSFFLYPEQERGFIRLEIGLVPGGVEPSRKQYFEELFWNIADPRSSQYGRHLSMLNLTNLLGTPRLRLDRFVSQLKTKYGAQRISVSTVGDHVTGIFPLAAAESMLSMKLVRYYSRVSKQIVLASPQSYIVPDEFVDMIDIVHGVQLPQRTPSIPDYPAAVEAEQMPAINSAPPSFNGLLLPNSGQAGNGTLYILVLPFCADGSMTQNVTNPCAETPPAVSSYDIIYSVKGSKRNITSQIPVQAAACEPSAYFPGMFCSIHVDGIPSGATIDIYTRSTFENGKVGNTTYYQPIHDTLYVDPHTLYRIHNIPSSVTASNWNQQSMVQFQSASFAQDDLDQFLKLFKLPNVPVKVVGVNNASYVNYEPQLDIQMLAGVGRGATTWAWINNDSDFLGWAIEANKVSFALPHVFSISYGLPADGTTKAYRDRFDYELQKLGIRGVTVLASTGDSGTQVGNFSCARLKTSVLASSPYITAVGGTTLIDSGEQIGVQADKGMYYTASGGFSWYRSRPTYQEQAVSSYLNTSESLPAPSSFNRNGRTVPDVSAIGLNEFIVSQHALLPSGGTSTSSPIFAGMVTLLNAERHKLGKSTLGFINPLLYQNPGAFVDVVEGDNDCEVWNQCCTNGFKAQIGYDPVSGLGTLNYEKLVEVVRRLP